MGITCEPTTEEELKVLLKNTSPEDPIPANILGIIIDDALGLL